MICNTWLGLGSVVCEQVQAQRRAGPRDSFENCCATQRLVHAPVDCIRTRGGQFTSPCHFSGRFEHCDRLIRIQGSSPGASFVFATDL